LRGHANSPGRERLHRHRLLDYVDDVVEVAGSLPAPPIVLGHSMGGAITQLVALHHPELVRAAVLFTPMVPGGLKVREVVRTARRSSVRSFVRLLRGRRLTPEQANRLPFFDRRLDDAGARLVAERLQAESWRALADITRFRTPRAPLPVPALVLGSREDSIFGTPPLRRTADQYGLDAVVLDVGCHDLMLDPDWRTSAGLIADWMEKL
jgi:non-heme chloroperoxidase